MKVVDNKSAARTTPFVMGGVYKRLEHDGVSPDFLVLVMNAATNNTYAMFDPASGEGAWKGWASRSELLDVIAEEFLYCPNARLVIDKE